MNSVILQAKEFFSPMQADWAICGGFALDLFLNRKTRRHSDLDVCVFEPDREAVCAWILQHSWNVFEFQGQGLLRPIYAKNTSIGGHNLMCVRDCDCDLVEFGLGPDGLYDYRFDYRGIVELNYVEFLFNQAQDGYFVFGPQSEVRRDLKKAILQRDGIPYLAPELALLYKSQRPDQAKFREDWDRTAPCLDEEQREWLRGALASCNQGDFQL